VHARYGVEREEHRHITCLHAVLAVEWCGGGSEDGLWWCVRVREWNMREDFVFSRRLDCGCASIEWFGLIIRLVDGEGVGASHCEEFWSQLYVFIVLEFLFWFFLALALSW